MRQHALDMRLLADILELCGQGLDWPDGYPVEDAGPVWEAMFAQALKLETGSAQVVLEGESVGVWHEDGDVEYFLLYPSIA